MQVKIHQGSVEHVFDLKKHDYVTFVTDPSFRGFGGRIAVHPHDAEKILEVRGLAPLAVLPEVSNVVNIRERN